MCLPRSHATTHNRTQRSAHMFTVDISRSFNFVTVNLTTMLQKYKIEINIIFTLVNLWGDDDDRENDF